jgi:hypothetical protein
MMSLPAVVIPDVPLTSNPIYGIAEPETYSHLQLHSEPQQSNYDHLNDFHGAPLEQAELNADTYSHLQSSASQDTYSHIDRGNESPGDGAESSSTYDRLRLSVSALEGSTL